MLLVVASENPVKVRAVQELLSAYPLLNHAQVRNVHADSGVSEQPLSLDETVQGAITRAKSAYLAWCNPSGTNNTNTKDFSDCPDCYSIGIEDGLMEVPHTKTGFMNVTCCALFDGKHIALGLSSCFEYPPKVTDYLIHHNLDVNQAFFKEKLTKNPTLGSAEGAIGLLTQGRLPRKEIIKQAVRMALIQLEKKEWYANSL